MTTQDRRPAWRRAASGLKRQAIKRRKLLNWASRDFVANPHFALYARRQGQKNYAFLLDEQARQDWTAPFDDPEIPRIVWIYWHQGASNAPFIVRQCIESWRRRNPGWEVSVLSAQTVSDYVDMSVVPPGLPLT